MGTSKTENRRKLFSVSIHDCRVDTFTVGGNGGGGKDTSSTGVRVVHEPSGAEGRATDTRSQLENKRKAFRRMAETVEFKNWIRFRVAELSGLHKRVEQEVEDAMRPENLKVEVQQNGKWTVDDCGASDRTV